MKRAGIIIMNEWPNYCPCCGRKKFSKLSGYFILTDVFKTDIPTYEARRCRKCKVEIWKHR